MRSTLREVSLSLTGNTRQMIDVTRVERVWRDPDEYEYTFIRMHSGDLLHVAHEYEWLKSQVLAIHD